MRRKEILFLIRSRIYSRNNRMIISSSVFVMFVSLISSIVFVLLLVQSGSQLSILNFLSLCFSCLHVPDVSRSLITCPFILMSVYPPPLSPLPPLPPSVLLLQVGAIDLKDAQLYLLVHTSPIYVLDSPNRLIRMFFVESFLQMVVFLRLPLKMELFDSFPILNSIKPFVEPLFRIQEECTEMNGKFFVLNLTRSK